MNQPYHLHCTGDPPCEKAQGERDEHGKLICARCGAPFVPCTPETCPDAGGNRP